uniref:Olfactory receptor n=1 Tax=Pelusios castaneus TaxID=367368 RepID=A0A8C8S8E5_9SAUR
MSNRTTLTEFLLLGFSDVRELQILHFVGFLVIYLTGLMGNLLIFIAITFDHRLHTPMYFFLMNLSVLDLGSVSVSIPKSMAVSLLNTRSISYAGCVAQVFFFLFLVATDFFLLTIMAYDRYIAICQPLHYERVMNRSACVQMAAGAWITGVLYSVLHTSNTFALPFCGGKIVNQFFFLGCFVFIIVSYVQIFKSVLRICSEQGRHKAFSTCLPHLTVVSLLVCTAMIAYLKPSSNSVSRLDLVLAVLYSVLPPVMNPVIYSMRNKDIQAALRSLIGCR